MSSFKITVPAKSSKEARIIERALLEEDIRAFVLITGLVKDFEPEKQKLIMDFVAGTIKLNG